MSNHMNLHLGQIIRAMEAELNLLKQLLQALKEEQGTPNDIDSKWHRRLTEIQSTITQMKSAQAIKPDLSKKASQLPSEGSFTNIFGLESLKKKPSKSAKSR